MENIVHTNWPPNQPRQDSALTSSAPLPPPETPVRPSPAMASEIPTPAPYLPTQTPHAHPPVSAHKKKHWQNGYEVDVTLPSYWPYDLHSAGRKRHKAIKVDNARPYTPLSKPLSSEEWNKLTWDHGTIAPLAHLWDFQVNVSNIVVQRKSNVVAIAPTGSGKSLIWTLPLFAQVHGISLVITPLCSVGQEGAQQYVKSQLLHQTPN